MIKKAKFTYGKMDMDTSPSKSRPEFYYKGNNIRVLTVGDSTTGSVANEKGTKHLITIPDVFNVNTSNPEYAGKFVADGVDYFYNNTSLSVIPDQTNLVIIGMEEIRDEIVVFTTSTSNTGFTDTVGQIWVVDASDVSNPTISLKYNNVLNFSTSKPIKSVVNKYENESVVKTYWSDFNENLRFFNLRAENSFDIEPTVISASPGFNMSQPQLKSITSGSIEAGVTAYGYVLVTRDGASSKVSALSNLYDANTGLAGLNLGENSGMGYEMTIDNIDTNYSVIKVYRIHYTSLDQLPIVNLIRDENVTSSSLTFTDDGTQNIEVSSLDALLFSGNDPFKCKILEVKENRLFPMNVKYENFDVDFDARAFRFDSTGTALLKDNSLPDIYVTNDYSIVPETFDCINPSNSEEPTLDYRQSGTVQNPEYMKYIYQSDGTTIGAEGQNIRLSFQFNKRKYDSLSQSNSKEYVRINSKRDRAEDTLYASLKRDEIYRFGIVFIKNTGQISFPKWICDLRVPNQNTTGYAISERNGGELELVSVGVQVQFKTNPNLGDDVIGWRIVRAKRTDNDKTILGQGILNSALKSPYLAENAGASSYANNRLQPDYVMRTMHDGTPGSAMTTFNNATTLNSEIGSQVSSANDFYRMQTDMIQMYTPEVIFNPELSTAPSDYITIVGGIENDTNTTGACQTWVYEDDKDNLWGQYNYLNLRSDQGFIIPFAQSKYSSFIRKGGAIQCNDIGKADIFGEAFVTPAGGGVYRYDNGFGTTEFVNDIFINRRQSSSASYKNREINGQCITFNIGLSSGAGNGIEKVIKDNTDQLFNVDSTPRFILADYKRSVVNQYGGANYEAIQRTDYMPVGDYTPINVLTSTAFNGDTFVTMFNLSRTEAFSTDAFIDGSGFRETIIFPVESYSNLALRSDEASDTMGEIQKIEIGFDELYDYNTVYSQQNDAQTFASKPFNFTEISEFDTRILGSEVKINGELEDNWVNYLANNYIDIEGDYGPINGASKWRNEIYAFQREGAARIIISPRVTVNSTEGLETQLGTGRVLENYQYVSTTNGIINQNAVVSAPGGIYFFDGKDMTINKVTGLQDEPVSLVHGAHSELKSNTIYDEIKVDNLILGKGVFGYYDEQTKHVLFTVKQSESLDNQIGGEVINSSIDRSYTLGFSDLIQGYTSFLPYTPSRYANVSSGMVSTNNSNNAIYIHNLGDYGSVYEETVDSSVTLLLNPDYDYSKTFDVLSFNSSTLDDGIDVAYESVSKIRVYNDYQDSGYVNLIDGQNITRRFREWRIQLPRHANSRNRIRGQYTFVELIFDNNNNKSFRLDDVILTYTLIPASYI
jgi:hypothetical protein